MLLRRQKGADSSESEEEKYVLNNFILLSKLSLLFEFSAKIKLYKCIVDLYSLNFQLFYRDSKDKLDVSTVKNLIGRSHSIKSSKKDDKRSDVKRAISFKHPGAERSLSPPPVLQKAFGFKEGEGVIVPDNEDHDITTTPNLPEAPPPEITANVEVESHGTELTKKEKLSPPVSPRSDKRVESHETKEKKKRTASFNIRRRTRSFKDKFKLPENLAPLELEAMMDRKQEHQSGGKRAAIRSWKNYYTALFGQVMAFFRDREGKMD